MSIIGGAGMLGFTMWTPVIGGWIDEAKAKAVADGLSGDAVMLTAGQETLGNILYLPLGLIAAFAVLFVIRKKFQNNGVSHG